MLDFEAALAAAEAEAGVIPATAVAPIAAPATPSSTTSPEIGKAAALAGNVAIPLVKALTAQGAREARAATCIGARPART